MNEHNCLPCTFSAKNQRIDYSFSLDMDLHKLALCVFIRFEED